LRFSDSIPSSAEASAKLESGDLLLIDSDAALWKTTPAALRSRLCAARASGESASTLMLIRWLVDTLFAGKLIAYDEEGMISAVTAYESGADRARPLDFEDEWDDTCEQPSPATTEQPTLRVRASQIAGVVILIVRSYYSVIT
jgi:hypothetical protein